VNQTLAIRQTKNGRRKKNKKLEREQTMKVNPTLALAAAGLAFAFTTSAQPWQMTSGNAVVNVQNTAQGVSDYIVDGVDQLYTQWFYYRVTGGTLTAPPNYEQPINALGLASVSQTAANQLTLTYGGPNSGFTIRVQYQLAGGAAGSFIADMSEQITVTSLQPVGTPPLQFHFFQYSDFDLAGTSGNDIGTLTSPNLIRQTDTGGSLMTISETIALPGASRWEINTFPTVLGSLLDGGPTTLANAGSPTSGDVEWAFQWDFTVAAGDSYDINKHKRIDQARVPDAGSTVAMLGMAMTALAMIRRRVAR
jgi:hypothetical protein